LHALEQFWVKFFEHYWTHQVDQIKQRAERKALERLIRLDDDSTPWNSSSIPKEEK